MYDNITEKIKQVDVISHKTSLLAINATVEVSHALRMLTGFEKIVADSLLTEAKIIAYLLDYTGYQITSSDFIKICNQSFMEDVVVTDKQGKIILSNQTAKIGSTLAGSDVFYALNETNPEVVLRARDSAHEGKQLKTVAINRWDNGGIIQLSSHFSSSSGQVAINGFGAVTQEAKRLADTVNEIYTRIDLNTDESIERTIKNALRDLFNIASQLNLLGIRAAIEAAHSGNETRNFDDLLNEHMTKQASLAAHLVETIKGTDIPIITDIAERVGIGEFWITSSTGKVELTNIPGGDAFSFTHEGQTGPYMKILEDPSLVVTAPPAKRDLDGKVYKFAAVGRRDKPGIFQIGIPSEIYGESTSEGFMEVARQIKVLAAELTEAIANIEKGLED